MKKVYDYQQLIYIKGRMEDFYKTSIRKHLILLSDETMASLSSVDCFSTFKELFEAVLDNKIWNAEAGHTFFLKRPEVYINCGLECYHVTERNFTEIRLWHYFADASDEPMTVLMKELPADEFAEYLKERNICLLKEN